MTILNTHIDGINYINVTTVDPILQAPCPLEGTALAGQCTNEYHNTQLRPEGTCVHSDACSQLLLNL